MPNPVARKGIARPSYELNQCNVVTVSRFVMNVTSSGIISVARQITNRVRLKGKRKNAKA